MSLEPSNTILAVGSIDGYITFWDLRLGHHLFTINAFSPILTLEFRPQESATREVVLMSTCSDGYAKFWAINLQQRTFGATPIKFHCKSLARDEIRCASFSPAGLRFITGATDGIVRLFSTPDVATIKSGTQPPILLPHVQYLEEHEGYVNSIYFGTRGTEFVTSSWDGCVRRWAYDAEGKRAWTSEAFSTAAVLGDSRDAVVPGRPRKVTIVTYCCGDEKILAAVGQSFELILFDARRRKPAVPLRYHQAEVFILTTNPVDDRIVLSAGCDGQAALWNTQTGRMIFEFRLDNCRFLDGGFSQNGSMFALVDDLGRVSVFGCGISPDTFAEAPASQFFPTDWNELVFDGQRNAVDAITQRPPHLVPRDVIVSIEKKTHTVHLDEGYAASIPIEGEENLVLRQRQLFQRQHHNEQRLFSLEVKNTPPGSVPKHTRTRRRRLLYGSDVEEDSALMMQPDLIDAAAMESDDEPFQMASGSETDAELSVTSSEAGASPRSGETSPTGPYNFRRRAGMHSLDTASSPGVRRRRLTPRQERRLLMSELELNDDSLYRPQPAHPAHGPRSTLRRRPLIPETSSSESGEPARPGSTRRGRPLSRRTSREATNVIASCTLSAWVKAVDRQVFPYLPQVYDVVAYFPEGHRMFLKRERAPQFHERLPWETEPHLDPVTFGQVITLNFFPGNPTWCVLELLLLEPAQARESLPPPAHVDSSRKIQIAFYDMENQPDFIIPYCRYAWSVQSVQRYVPGEIVRVVFSRDEIYEARVKKLRVAADRIPQRPWQCYLVEWLTLSDAPEYLSPWELETIFEEDVPARQPYTCHEFIDADTLRVLDEGVKRLLTDPRAAPFCRPVDLRYFPDYPEFVAYPMDLHTLHQRIVNGQHRRMEALEWDARLIYDNAFAYNLPDSDIVQDAEYVVNEIMRLVKRAERGVRRASRRIDALADSLVFQTEASSPHSGPAVPTPRRNATQLREERARRRAALAYQSDSSNPPSSVTPPRSRPRGATTHGRPIHRPDVARLDHFEEARTAVRSSPRSKRRKLDLDTGSSSTVDDFGETASTSRRTLRSTRASASRASESIRQSLHLES